MKKVLIALLLCVLCGVCVYFFTARNDRSVETETPAATDASIEDGEMPAPAKIITSELDRLADREGKTVGYKDFQGKYAILAFWNMQEEGFSAKMDSLQVFYDETKESVREQIVTVCVLDEKQHQTTDNALVAFQDHGWQMPLYTISSEDPGYRALGIGDPETLLMVNKEGRIFQRLKVQDFIIRFRADMARLTSK